MSEDFEKRERPLGSSEGTDAGTGSTTGEEASWSTGGATGETSSGAGRSGGTGRGGERTWTEQIEVAGNQLVDRIKELIGEGNVRRVIIRKPDDEVLLEVPLTAGVAAAGVVTVFAPLLAALGAMAALVAKFKVEIVRSGEPGDKL